MDVSKLFYPSTEALDAEAQAKMKKTGISELRISRLPTPSIHYQPFLPIEPDCSIGALALLGESKNKILLFLDEAGNTSIYNIELSSLTATPILNSPKDADCVAVSIPGAAAAASRAMSDSDDHRGNLYVHVGYAQWHVLFRGACLRHCVELALECALASHRRHS